LPQPGALDGAGEPVPVFGHPAAEPFPKGRSVLPEQIGPFEQLAAQTVGHHAGEVGLGGPLGQFYQGRQQGQLEPVGRVGRSPFVVGPGVERLVLGTR